MPQHQRHREPTRRVFAVFGARSWHQMPRSDACAVTPFGRTVDSNYDPYFPGKRSNMTGAIPALSHRLRPLLAAICLGAASILISAPVVSVPALARGPEGIADVAEKVIDAVVNISTSQTIEAKGDGRGTMPQLPPGS